MSAPTTEPEATEAAPEPARRALLPALGSRQAWLLGPLAAGWAALIGLALVALTMAVVWALSVFDGMDIVDSMRMAGLMWLVAHDVPLQIGTATFSLLPWGLALISLVLLVIGGRWAARAASVASIRDAVVLVLSGSVVYGLVLAGVSAATATADARTLPARAFGVGFAIAVLGLSWGVYRVSIIGELIRQRMPDYASAAVRGAFAGFAAIVGLGAVLAGLSLALNLQQALEMQAFLDAGTGGGLVLLLIGLGYAPIAIMWSVAYLLGAGIAIGPDAVLSPFMQAPAPANLPAFPLLAALPDSATPSAWALPILGVVAGIVAGLIVVRRGSFGALQRAGIVVLASVLAAIALAMAARLSFGSLGDVRLVGLGPSSESVALVSGLLLIVGGVPSALVAGRRPRAADVE